MATVLDGSRCELYQPPTVKKFTSRHADEMGRYLRELDASTTVMTFVDVAELQLDERTWRTRSGGYQYTTGGFSQVAQIAAPGLSKLLPDIAGMTTSIDDRDRMIHGTKAVRIFNEILDLRAPLFDQYRIIRHEDGKTIEGLVGMKHQFLENLMLYDQASESVLKNRPEVVMAAGYMVGRRMAVWYRSNTPFHEITIDDKPWPLYYGYYFCNGEATGMAVRATLAIFTPQGVCLGPYKQHGGRVAHTGREFYGRLGRLFETVTTANLPLDSIRGSAGKMLETSLGYTGLIQSKDIKKRTASLANSLSGLGLPQKMSRDIVTDALHRGRVTAPQRRPITNPARQYGSRTLFDLFTPLMRWARNIDLSRREKVEQAAFAVLTGRFLV